MRVEINIKILRKNRKKQLFSVGIKVYLLRRHNVEVSIFVCVVKN
jgi:hypothetical protein